MSKNSEEKKSVDDEKNNDIEQSPINNEILEDKTSDQSNIEEENNTEINIKEENNLREFALWILPSS